MPGYTDCLAVDPSVTFHDFGDFVSRAFMSNEQLPVDSICIFLGSGYNSVHSHGTVFKATAGARGPALVLQWPPHVEGFETFDPARTESAVNNKSPFVPTEMVDVRMLASGVNILDLYPNPVMLAAFILMRPEFARGDIYSPTPFECYVNFPQHQCAKCQRRVLFSADQVAAMKERIAVIADHRHRMMGADYPKRFMDPHLPPRIDPFLSPADYAEAKERITDIRALAVIFFSKRASKRARLAYRHILDFSGHGPVKRRLYDYLYCTLLRP